MPGRSVMKFIKNRAQLQLGGALAAGVRPVCGDTGDVAGSRRNFAGPRICRSRNCGRWCSIRVTAGADKGAVGSGGLEEKALVLSTARIVRRFLERDSPLPDSADPATTTGTFRLRARYEFARRRRADLFVSIHADANPLVEQRGLSVYTLSARASDRLAARLAERHNRSDAIAGINLRGAGKSVSSILLDLVKRETRAGSARISSLIVRSARNRVQLLRKPQRSANFAVLRAPDVPSVLVELGFLTNARDEELLRTMKYRKRLAAVLARAIAQYFSRLPQADRAGYRADGTGNLPR